MKNPLFLTIVYFSCFSPSLQADDYQQTIDRASQLFFQGGGDLKQEYVNSETKYGHAFNNIHATQYVPQVILKEMKILAIQKHPWYMEGRMIEMQLMMVGYYFLKQGKWGDEVPEDAKTKILEVGKLLYGKDYGDRYRWAIDESIAYYQLKKIKFDISVAKKKYPNSYQSQLHEALGIRPKI